MINRLTARNLALMQRGGVCSPVVVDYHCLAEARVNQFVVPGYASVQSRPGKTEGVLLFSIAAWHCRCHSSIRTEITARRCRLKVGSPRLLSIQSGVVNCAQRCVNASVCVCA